MAIYAVRLLITEAANSLLTMEQKKTIVTEVMKKAEQHRLEDGNAAIFEIDNHLKAVLSWEQKTIHIMTREEADRSFIPKPGCYN